LPVGGRRVNAIEDLASVPHIMCSIAQERTLVSADAIAGVLGGIGRRRAVSMDFALTEAVRSGLPIAALDRLIANGVIAEHEVETRFIPRRTLYARRQKGTFSREQSDLIVRLARIQAMADDVFGERPRSHSWLRRQNGALDGEIPLALPVGTP
jgi:putative toxin-antitoxin system antitoxin component (TIGR02293 family)